MASRTLAVAIAACAAGALAQSTPLYQKHFEWNNLPYKVDTDTGERGTQFGFNLCNSTTENQQSNCQTAVVNSIDDFCLWGGPEPGSVIGNTEASSVAWCTKPGHGTRTIPAGAITGVQFMQTPAYLQVTGHIDQTAIDLAGGDDGGEMDPHGADEQGNPLGGLVFSNGFPGSGGDKTKYIQAIEWHNFMGGNVFCFKICDPSNADAAKFCDHIYDRIGCEYNAPAAYVDGVFESCKGENQDFPGHYKDAAGNDVVYQQPPEANGPITSIPYVARIPASSECVQYKSADLFAAAASVTYSKSTTAPSTKSTAKPSNTNTKASSTKSTATSTATGAAGRVSGGYAAGIIGALAAFVAAL